MCYVEIQQKTTHERCTDVTGSLARVGALRYVIKYVESSVRPKHLVADRMAVTTLLQTTRTLRYGTR